MHRGGSVWGDSEVDPTCLLSPSGRLDVWTSDLLAMRSHLGVLRHSQDLVQHRLRLRQ